MASFSSKVLNEICSVLESYRGRDKFLRTLCYVTRLIGGLSNDQMVAIRWLTFSSRMSGTRTILRLLDDLPMLQYTLEYGLGKEEPDNVLASLGVVTNIIDQVYFPIEKVAWLAENKLISVKDSSAWDTATSICWAASTYLSIMRSIWYIRILQKHKLCIDIETDAKALAKLLTKERMEILSCIRLTLDFIHAIHGLPSGFLWSSKLNTWQAGLVGTLSSFIGLYQLFAKRAQTN